MKQKLKKSLSLLLATVMLLGLIPGAALAEEVVDEVATNSLTLTAGMGMTGENLDQTAVKGQPITPVVLTAEEGFAFPEDYAVSTLEAVGLTVLRDNEAQVTISGDLTATLIYTLPDAVAVAGEKVPVEEEPVANLALGEPRAASEITYSANASVASLAAFTNVTVEAGVTVTLTGTTTLTQNLVITGDGTFKRGAACTGDMFIVAADKTLTMNDSLTLDGASILAGGSAVRVENKGTFAMEDGTIQNFRSSKNPGGAAVYVAGNNDATPGNNGTFTMTGGTIKDNRFESKTVGIGGGAISVLGNFTMTGGLIANNYSDTNGGAIGLLGNNFGGRYASVAISGTAQIVGNTARRWGGAMEAMANRDCGGGEPAATLTISGDAVITGNLSGYRNDRLNDGFGGGLDTSDWGGTSTFTVGGSAQITGNNHWTSSGYSQDNLYCGTNVRGGWPVLGENFTGSIGVSPSSTQGENASFGDEKTFEAPLGSFFYDGKALVNKANDLVWVKGEAAKTITKVTVDAAYTATVTPTNATVTYQWYVSDTASVGGGLPIPSETTATLSSAAQKETRGRYVYVIADGKGGYTGRATSTPVEVAPEVTPIRGDFTLYYNPADGLLHKGSLTGAPLTPAAKYGYSGNGNTLTLKGIDFITSKGGIEMPYNTNIELADGTVNYIESTSRTGDDWADSGIHVGLRSGGSNNTLTIKGTGSLTVKGACAAIMVHYSSLVIEGSAVVMAEGNGYLGNDRRDSAGIYAQNGIAVQGSANVTALGGPCAQNSYGAGSNKGGVTVKGTAVLTVAGGQTRDKSGTYRSMGIATADKFNIADDASVIARGDTVAADIWYTSDQGKNNLSEAQINTMFAGTTIVASVQANGSSPVAGTTAYVAFADNLDWKKTSGTIYKWAHIYPTGSSAAGILVNPTFLNASGDYSGEVAVDIASAGADIFYTTNSTEPSKTNGSKYSATFDITKLGLTTVKAIAYKGSATSPVTTVTYNVLAAPKLTGLTVTGYTLAPAFTADNFGPYVVVVPTAVATVNVIPTASAPIVVKNGNDTVNKSGSAYPISLTAGATAVVTIEVGSEAKTTYTLNLRRPADAGILADVYEPLAISSGFNKDVVVEKPGTPSNSAVAFDGLNADAQWAFFSAGYKADANNMPTDRIIKNPNITDAIATYKLADYAGKNSVQMSWDNPSAKIEVSHIGAYERLSILGASGNADGRFRATIYYTDGSTSTATFTAPNWSYRPGVSLQNLSRVKLIGAGSTPTGKIEEGFAMYAFDIPVTQGKLVSHLEVTRTDTTTGDTAARTNIMAVSGVVAKGTPKQPETEAPAKTPDGALIAKWGSDPDAIGYYIDIATDKDFLDMLPGYDNKKLEPGQYADDGDTVSYTTDITSGSVYYRVRAIGADGKPGQSSDSQAGDLGGSGTGNGSLQLNGAVQGESQTYTFPNAVVGTETKTIIVGFADTVNDGDWIELPNSSGFSVSSGSNDYSKRITVGAGKKAADIQDYLRQIVFHLGKISYTDTGKQVQVTLDSKLVDNDTFYFEETEHYYQYVPLGGKNWMQCYEAAKGMTYAGRKGYLATVTSENEDMFIKSLSGQIGWLGGTRMVVASDTKDTNTQYFAKSVFDGISHNAGDHSSNPWIWACGPEIGTEIPTTNNTVTYANWNSGEPNGQTASGDSHECALTTLFKGTSGYSWNDRSPYAGPSVGTAGYQPYGYFVEFGNQTTGDSGIGSAANTSVMDTGTINKATTGTASGGTDSLDMTQMPEFDPANPDWKPVPGTSPAEYRYEGTAPANDGTWEWVYTSDNKGTPGQDDYYSLVLKGVNITTTNRPAINLPDLPRGSMQPVRIKVQDGTQNSITNLEDTDLTTNVTIINSQRDLVIEPLGSKADGTLKLIGSNLPNSKEGVFGIASYGKVTVSSLEMTIELTDNRTTDGGTPTTGIKSETGDIVLDNPKLDIIIHDNRPFVGPATSATPPARGLEPGYPSKNIIINGGEVDIKFDGTPNTPKGDKTYPTYRPVIVNGEEKDPTTSDLFPIRPAAPEAVKAGNNITIYAKGSALLVKEGTSGVGYTSIYYDADRSGTVTGSETFISLGAGNGTTENIDNTAQTITLYAGGNDMDAAGWPLMTIAGGKVNTVYAGGYATSNNIKLTGAPVINITGGTVEQIYDGGNNTVSKKSAITTGVVTVNVTGGTVTRLDSRADAATRSDSVYVNMFGVPGGKIVTLTPNAKNPINLSIEGAAKVGGLLDFKNLAGGHINVTGPLTSGTEITFEETLVAFAPDTLLAKGATEADVKLGNFYLLDSATRKTAKGVQVVTAGKNGEVVIAAGGPTKLENLDLGDLSIPTDSSHVGWTGPNEDGKFDYNAPDGEGWELKYDPKADDNNGRYYLTMDGLNIDAATSPALQLPSGKPTTIIVVGENKLVVRGSETDPMIGIDAPMGVDFEGKDKTKDILSIVVNNGGTGAVTGVKSDKGITITDATIKVLLPGVGAPAKGMEAKEDVVIKDADVVIDIPVAAPATGITTPGNIEIRDTKPSDGKRPTIEINIEGDPDKESTGLEAGKDIIIGGEIHIDITTGKPAIGIKAEDDVIIKKGDPTKPENDDGAKPNIDINIGDEKKPKPSPAIGIQAGDKTDDDNDSDRSGNNGGIIIGGEADVNISIPTPPGNYPANPTTDNKPNKGLDSKGDVIIGGGSDIIIDMVGPGTGINGDSDGNGKGDVIIEDSDVIIRIKNDPTGSPTGPIIGIEGENVTIKDTDPTDGKKPNVDITVGEKGDTDTAGAPSTGIKADEDVVIEGGNLTIDIPITGKPSKGIEAGDDVIIIPGDPGKKPDGTPDPANKPGEKPKVDITIGDKDDPNPTDKGPSTGIEAGDKTVDDNAPGRPGNNGGIIIDKGEIIITIPNAPANYPTDGPNNGLDSKGDIIIGGGSDITIDMTGPGTGIKGEDDVIIEDSNVTEHLKNHPTGNPTGPIIGIESEKGDVVIKDTDPTDGKKPEIDITIGDKSHPNTGGKPGRGIQAGDDVMIAGPDININIPTGKPAIGIEAKDDVVIQPGDRQGNKPGEKPKVDIVIGDKLDPNTGGSPATGIKADDTTPGNEDSGKKGGVDIEGGDINIDITIRPYATKPNGDPDPSKGIESGGDVEFKDSDVNIDMEDKTKPKENEGPIKGIEADGNVTADDTNLDITVTGRPGKGIEPTGDVVVKGDTNLDIVVDGPKDTNPPTPGYEPSPAVDGEIEVTPGGKPNIIVKGVPNAFPDGVTPPAGFEEDPTDPGKLIMTNGVTVALKVPGSGETNLVKVPGKDGTIYTAITPVTGVIVSLKVESLTRSAVTFDKTSIKVGEVLSTNCPGVIATVTAVRDNELTVTLSGTPTAYRGNAVTVTIPAGKISGFKGAMKATDENALWAIAMLDTIGREDSLDLKPDPNDPNKKIEYIDKNGETQEKKVNEDITDTAEGWEWYPDNGEEDVTVDGKKYPRPVMILDDVNIKPADPTKPGIVVPDGTVIVVPAGSDNIIEGHPAIKTDGEPGEITVTGPGNLILKGVPGPNPGPAYPAIEGKDEGSKPIILVDPDTIVNGDNHPVEKKEKKDPGTGDPVYDADGNPIYEIETPADNNTVFGHVSAILNNVKKGGIPGTINTAIADTSAKVKLENANLMPGKVTTRTLFDTNTAGVKAKVVETLGGNTINILLTGTPATKTNEKIMVFVPAEYVLEGAALTATSTERWNVVDPPAPNPGGGGGDTPTPPGSVTVDNKDKDVEIKKEVKREDDKKINIFTPDKEQLDDLIKDLGKGDEIIINVKRDSDADEVIIKLNGKTLDEMGKKDLDVKVLDAPISIVIPAKNIDLTPILKELGGEPKDLDVNIRIYEPAAEEKEKIKTAIETDGSKQTDEPISFEISVSKGGKTVPVDGFGGYITVVLQITEEQAKLITTAITWQKDGSLLHIPTYVRKEGGKYYAKVNALVNCTTTLIFNEQHFVDTAGTWYDTVATELASRKIMNGVGNSKFEGGLNITRAEFAVIVARALGLPASDTSAFSDVSAADWYAGAAGAAAKYGIVNGVDGKFMPMNQITRQEAMAIIARAAKVAQYTGTTGSVSGYPDSGALADWAKEAAAMTVGSGLIKGNDGQLRPTDTITRGETAVLILRLLQKADLVDVRSEA